MDVETGCAKFDLHLELDEFPTGIGGRFIYNTDLFERSTIEQMIEDWRAIVSRSVADPSRRISQLLPDSYAVRKTALPEGMAASTSGLLSQPARLLDSVRRLFS
jgi:non-ribosomal peptide synthetase component F